MNLHRNSHHRLHLGQKDRILETNFLEKIILLASLKVASAFHTFYLFASWFIVPVGLSTRNYLKI
jgi:hypothetical protein